MSNERWHAVEGGVYDENRLLVCAPANEEDAPMIAAAPEMLAALKYLRRLILTHGDAETISRFENAMSAAEGR